MLYGQPSPEKETKEELAEKLMKRMAQYDSSACAKAFGLIYLADAIHKLVEVLKEGQKL